MNKKIKYLVAPNPQDKNLTKEIDGFDEDLKPTKTKVIIEKDLTIFLNKSKLNQNGKDFSKSLILSSIFFLLVCITFLGSTLHNTTKDTFFLKKVFFTFRFHLIQFLTLPRE